MRKKVVEEVPFIYVQELKSFEDGEEGVISVFPNSFTLYYQKESCTIYSNQSKESQEVVLNRTIVGYGERLWFCCPFCSKLCGRLYLSGDKFGCRKCQNLTYVSSQISGNDFLYLSREVRRTQRELGMNLDAPRSSPEYVRIYDRPFLKPKNMRWDKFEGLNFSLLTLQYERVLALDRRYKRYVN